MERATWHFAVLGLLATAVCAGDASYGSATAAAQAQTQPLFIIERSKNANVVHYDARLNADGKLESREPVIAYWIMLAEDGRREDLNWIEKKKAYGFDITPDPSGNGYKMTVVSAPDRRIPARCPERGAMAALDLGDVHAALRVGRMQCVRMGLNELVEDRHDPRGVLCGWDRKRTAVASRLSSGVKSGEVRHFGARLFEEGLAAND
jgi:hypothetical protein